MLYITIDNSSRFPLAPPTTKVLQRSIGSLEIDDSNYVAAMVSSLNGSSYFEVPNTQEHGIYTNGLKSKKLVSDCIQLHSSISLALESLKAFIHHTVKPRRSGRGYKVILPSCKLTKP